MFEAIKTHVVYPLFGRVGTGAATVLVGYGVNATHAQQIGLGLAAAGLVVFDLLVGYLNRKAMANRVFAKTVEGILSGRV